MLLTIYYLFIATAVWMCRAKVKLLQGNDISIEFDKPLTILCTNDNTSDVEFRHDHVVVANCFGTLGCNIEDRRFHITLNMSAGRKEYILTSNDFICPDLCGVYECCDLLSHEKDSAYVSIIGFDNENYNVIEETDTIVLTTACIFHVSLSDMQIYWYTYDNTTLKLLDETRMGSSMTPFNNESVCSEECGSLSAYRFTFGLNITDQEQGSTSVFIETKIFHPDYMNKSLTWRSSNTFRVKESSPKTPTNWVLLAAVVLCLVCVTVLIVSGFAVIRIRRKRSTNTPTCANTASLIFSSMLKLLSILEKATTPRHTETQSVGGSDIDSQCIVGVNTLLHLPGSCIHSQSDELISLFGKENVLRDDTETDSDIDTVYITSKDYLEYSGIHSQSGEDLSLSLYEKELSF